MANSELGGHFKEAVLAWIDPLVDPTQGVEQVIASHMLSCVAALLCYCAADIVENRTAVERTILWSSTLLALNHHR